MFGPSEIRSKGHCLSNDSLDNPDNQALHRKKEQHFLMKLAPILSVDGMCLRDEVMSMQTLTSHKFHRLISGIARPSHLRNRFEKWQNVHELEMQFHPSVGDDSSSFYSLNIQAECQNQAVY